MTGYQDDGRMDDQEIEEVLTKSDLNIGNNIKINFRTIGFIISFFRLLLYREAKMNGRK